MSFVCYAMSEGDSDEDDVTGAVRSGALQVSITHSPQGAATTPRGMA